MASSIPNSYSPMLGHCILDCMLRAILCDITTYDIARRMGIVAVNWGLCISVINGRLCLSMIARIGCMSENGAYIRFVSSESKPVSRNSLIALLALFSHHVRGGSIIRGLSPPFVGAASLSMACVGPPPPPIGGGVGDLFPPILRIVLVP